MSDFETIARPYSKALFELAAEGDSLQAWSDSLAAAAMIAEDKSMQAMLELSTMLPSEHVELLLSVYAGIDSVQKASEELKNLFSLLAEHGRLPALPAIAAGYEMLKREAEGKIDVQVTSAQKLTNKQKDEIARSMQKKLGKEVSITSEVDATLIAGAIIRAGDLVIDGSLLARLNKLSTALNK